MNKMFGFQRLLEKLGTRHSLFLSVYSEVLDRPIRLADFEGMARIFMNAVKFYGSASLDEGFDPNLRDDIRVFIASKMSGGLVTLYQERYVTKKVDSERQYICLAHVLLPSGNYHYELGYQDEDGQWFCYYDPSGLHGRGEAITVTEGWNLRLLQYPTL